MAVQKSSKKVSKSIISCVDAKIRKNPLYKMDKVTLIRKEQTYRGIAIASIVALYCVILFVIYLYFNYNIMFFPKV